MNGTMTDALQQFLHAAAAHNAVLAALAVACATSLLFVLVAGLAALGLTQLRRIHWALVVRVAVSLMVAGALTLLLNRWIQDPRPFVAEHYAPLAHVNNDNGFPSDHTLVAALLACWAWWMDRRWAGLFIAGLLAVMLGRLAIGAHHSADVVGSVVLALSGFALASVLPLPLTWRQRPLLPRR